MNFAGRVLLLALAEAPYFISNWHFWALKMRKSAHILLICGAGIGHLHPMMAMAKQLAQRGLSITVLLPHTFSYNLVSNSGIIGDLDIQIMEMNVEGQNEIQPRPRVTADGVRAFKFSAPQNTMDSSAKQSRLEEILRDFSASDSPPFCAIVDMLLTWSHLPLQQVGLPKYILYTAGVMFMTAFGHIRASPQNVPNEDENLLLPNFAPIPWKQVPPFLKDPTNQTFLTLSDIGTQFEDSETVFVNTFLDLDRKTLEALERQFPGAKFRAIGPLLQLKGDENDSAKKGYVVGIDKEAQCEEWLRKQAPNSVVFLSFGSWANLKESQVEELAFGLEASGQKFLWVLADNPPILLPEGFEERSQEQGIIIRGWAPQQFVLSHESVGGFVTHCGWNSVLECICLGGIPILCWPFTIDQPFSCRYLVDELKIGVDVKENEEGMVGRQEVERAVRILMQGNEAAEMMNRAKLLQRQARIATKKGGSSAQNLDAFVQVCLEKHKNST